MSGKTNGNCDLDLYEEVKIPVPWGYIAAKWWGSKDKQPVIAMHGWQDNAGTFDNLAPLLARAGIPVLCLDLPGHGYSSHFPNGMMYYIFWDGLNFLRRVIRHYRWTNVKLLGHSLGGAIAFLYASVYPKEIDRYVSLDIASPAVRNVTNILNKTGDIIDKFLKYENLTSDSMPCYEYEEMLDIVIAAYGGSCNRKSCEIMMKRGMEPDGKGSYHFSRDPRLKVGGLAMMDIGQALELSKRICCKVMNVRASPGMKFENPEYYDMVCEEIKKGADKFEMLVVEGTHHVHLNDADAIADSVIGFLK